uniref:Uncharacterized protein n=1 Tax=Caenorhabditis japonica TaxID=281687 RepID=A0A8R1ELA6_CAEJA
MLRGNSFVYQFGRGQARMSTKKHDQMRQKDQEQVEQRRQLFHKDQHQTTYIHGSTRFNDPLFLRNVVESVPAISARYLDKRQNF